MSLDYRDGRKITFFFYLNNQISLYPWNIRWKHEVLVFKVFGGGLHKLSHFNLWAFTLDFTWNYCRLLEPKNFSRNPDQYKWITRETRYPVFIAELLIENFKCQVVELVQRPTTMLEDTLFQWELLIFSKFTGGKVSLWPRSKTFLFIGRGGIIWYQRSNFSKLIHRGRYRGISQGHLDRVCKILLHSKMVHLLFIYFVNIAFTSRGANSAYSDKYMAKKAVF